jgi:hypothetical protein
VWPLLAVETEVKWGLKEETNEMGLFLVGSLGLSYQYNSFCSALAALVGPVQNIFFLTIHYFNSFVPIAQQAGRPAVRGRLSVSVCLWKERYQSSDADALICDGFPLCGTNSCTVHNFVNKQNPR